MSQVLFEIMIIFLLLVANGILAMSEIAVVSARKIRLQQWAEEGDARAQAALDLTTNPNQFLATIQIGITLVGILAGAFGGATLAEKIAAGLNTFPVLAPYSEALGVGIVVLVITYFSLVIGELVPKRLGLNNAEGIAMGVARPMRQLSRLTSPVVRLLSFSTDATLRLLGVRLNVEDPPVTEEEVKILLQQGTQSGVFAVAEQELIESVLRLDDRRVSSVMTPRPQIVCLDADEPAAETRERLLHSQHTRFPVIREELDHVLGLVQAKDLLAQQLRGEPFDLPGLLQPALFVPETLSVLKMLELFKQEATHLALVVDEYGGIQGLVTLNDILEAIVGDLPGPQTSDEPRATRRGDGSWLVDGALPVDKLKQIFDLDVLPDEDLNFYQTVAGFFIYQVRALPTVGQVFTWEGLRFEVVDMDGRRVDKVLITLADHPYAESEL